MANLAFVQGELENVSKSEGDIPTFLGPEVHAWPFDLPARIRMWLVCSCCHVQAEKLFKAAMSFMLSGGTPQVRHCRSVHVDNFLSSFLRRCFILCVCCSNILRFLITNNMQHFVFFMWLCVYDVLYRMTTRSLKCPWSWRVSTLLKTSEYLFFCTVP